MYDFADLELDLGVSAMPLSHSAARHKMSVRPKRTHGAPRRRRVQQVSVKHHQQSLRIAINLKFDFAFIPGVNADDLFKVIKATS
jgi:hypothetical protein